jgi:general secretion pathway protein G
VNAMKKRHSGFTFLEIMLVVVIIGILFSIVGPRLIHRAGKARIQATKAQMGNIKTALGMYEMHVGSFPTTAQGLKALFERPSDVSEDLWDGPYLDSKSALKDVWKHDFTYVCPGEHNKDTYDLSSNGADGKEGTEDDIVNWEEETEAPL